MKKWKIVISIVIVVFVFLIVFVFLSFNSITFETSLHLPIKKFPVYVGNSTYFFNASFTNSNVSFHNCTGGLCFFVENGNLRDFTKNYNGLQYQGEFINVTDESSVLIQRIKNGNFSTLGPHGDPQYPMSGLGSITIYAYDFGYYNKTSFNFEEGKGVYLPMWFLHARTSNYGEITILVWASSVN